MPRSPQSKYRWWVLAAMGCALGLVVLDETVVGVALPSIQADLQMQETEGHWVVNAYLLIFTGLVAAAGKLGDIISLKRLFLAGLMIFTSSSVACGFAQSAEWLIIMRAFQGLGAAAVFPGSVAIISKIFGPEERGLAYGIQTATAGFFLSMGPLVGGVFAELVSWRWIFWVNLPVIAFLGVVVALLLHLPEAQPKQRERFDFPGLIALLASSGGLIIAVMQGPDWGWMSPATLGLFALGLLSLFAFQRIERSKRDPLIDVSLFAKPFFSEAKLTILSGQFSKITVVVFGAIYLQQVQDLTPIDAGLIILIGILPALPVSLLTGRLSDRYGSGRIMLIGLSVNLMVQLSLLLAVVIGSLSLFTVALVFWGLSLPAHYVPPRRAAMNIVEPHQHGQAGGISVTAQLLGGAIAIAVVGAARLMTDSFSSLFVLTSLLGLAVLLAVWRSYRSIPAAQRP